MTTKNASIANSAEGTPTQPQLLLITNAGTSGSHWKLDEHTREVGLKGLAQARAALNASCPTPLDLAA